MAETKNIAVLFDFDGVVVDTETQYSVFWHKMGVDYLGMEDLESRVKGQTLMYIYDTFFPGMTKEREEITVGLDRFEQDMSYDFVPGVEEFIADLHRNGVKIPAPMIRKWKLYTVLNLKLKVCSTVFSQQKCSLPLNLHLIVFCLVWKYLTLLRKRLMFLRILLMV